MRNLTVQVPGIIQKFTKRLTWKVEHSDRVYLTFDDGPTPVVTEKVLDILEHYNVKATFFCIGRNVERHPDIYQKIQDAGMAVGNHTYSHLNGWKMDKKTYIDDVALASQLIDSHLFRPPYGKIRAKQSKVLSQQYKIIMWDVLTKDYALNIAPETCFKHVKQYTQPGSIIVFHDSKKAFKNLEYALPKSIEYLLDKGFLMDKTLLDAEVLS